MSTQHLSWRRWAAIGLIALLATASTAGMHSITEQWSFVVPAAMGALTAAASFVVAEKLRLLPGETLALALGLLVVGGVLAVSVGIGELPGLSSLGDFFDGLIRSWADLLSAVTPADLTPRLAVAPFALAWFGTIIGCALLRWSPLPTAPVLGPLVSLGVMVLLTDEERELSIAVGAAIAVGALLLGVFLGGRNRRDDGADEATSESTTSTSRHADTVRVALVLGAVAVAAPLLGPRLPLAEARPRYDLRDEVVPPWDPLSVPSPLVQVKGRLAAEREDSVVFEATADAPVTRWPTAVMSSYDGVVWTVADPDDAGSDFRPVGTRLPEPDAQPDTDPTVRATVTVDELRGPWLPVPGVARTLTFEGSTPQVLENPETNTLAVPNGVSDGLTYTVEALVAPERTDEELRTETLDVVEGSVDLEALPPQIRNLAADVTEGIDHGWGQIAAIRDLFEDEGFYDKSTRVPPGHSYYRLAQFLSDPDQIVGYEEQYAAGAALIARIADLPTRVVVGYEVEPDRWVDGTLEVRSSDASAWIEVRVDDVGWVPVSVSPPRSREPQTENAVASEDQVATPNPPPPPQVPPDIDVFTDNEELEEPVDEEEEDEEEDDPAAASGGLGTVGWVLVGTGGAMLLVLAAAAVVVGLKLARTRRRRDAADPATRVAGAWFEVAERYDEAGTRTPAHATPLESVEKLVSTQPLAAESREQLVGLARQVDRAAYGAWPPSQATADAAWRYSDEAVHALLAGRSRSQKTMMRVDPRPLLKRDPVRASDRRSPTTPTPRVDADRSTHTNNSEDLR